MKLARLLIVALLALVLPLRGALAFASSCEADTLGTQSEQIHDMAGQETSPEGDIVDELHSHLHPNGHSHDGVQHIVKCATSCTVAPVSVGDPHAVSAPVDGAVEFPLYAEPVTSFITAGPERPPQTL